MYIVTCVQVTPLCHVGADSVGACTGQKSERPILPGWPGRSGSREAYVEMPRGWPLGGGVTSGAQSRSRALV